MSDEVESFEVCEACGATVYPEHIAKRLAGRWQGKLLCRHCVAEKRQAAGKGPREDTIKLADTEGGASGHSTAIRSFGGGPGGMSDSMAGQLVHQREFRRPIQKGAPTATRCRTFHAKLTDASLQYMNDQINGWVDESDDIEIKFATSTIGVVEGKHADPHLIVTVFY